LGGTVCGATLFVLGLGVDMSKHGNTKHGLSKTATYRSWDSMIQRCKNPNNISYRYHGARGIRVCERWQGPNGFENFFADMGARPQGLTLERKDNNGNYEPSNCCWATPLEQAANTRNLKWFRAWHKDTMCQFVSNNQHEFARRWELDNRHISNCLKNIRKTHKNWKFQWII
jgi:hypothetical protein